MTFASFEEMQGYVGQEIAVTDWLRITQERVTHFAEVTDDPDWMHIDQARAATGPVGQTIAQGFLTLSLLIHFSHQANYLPANIAHAFNYGLDRVRWITPVKVGARIRNRVVLSGLEPRGGDRYLLTTSNTIEVEDESRPAMVARWLGLLQRAPTGSSAVAWRS
jgi:acyl dehydratase